MNPVQQKIIQITEYELKSFHHDEIPESVGIELCEKYRTQLDIEFPNYKTGGKWQIKAKGWVGYISLSQGMVLKINPKVPIKNLFAILEYAYQLKNFRFIEGLIDCESIEEFYNSFADVLAQQILQRCRQGLYRTYSSKTEQLSYVRGRPNLQQAIQKPWSVKIKCHYKEQTADIPENQILFWTLYIIARSGLCSPRVLPTVRKAYHSLQGWVTLQPYSANECLEQQYNRLNEDYRLLHHLCRLFLENTAPSFAIGDRKTLPFLIDMARIYELFVASLLKEHLPPNLIIKSQERINIDKKIHFVTDLVLYEKSTANPWYVLDTKYKAPASPSSDDIAQVLAYAVSKGCKQAILVYPTTLTHPLDQTIGDIRVRSLTFPLDDNSDRAVNLFLKQLFCIY